MLKENNLSLAGEYEAKIFCDLIHSEGAEVLAKYNSDFYKGMPALTCNDFGDGKAYYIAFRNNDEFLRDFYNALAKNNNLKRSIDVQLPDGVNAQVRMDENNEFIFIMNFNNENRSIDLKELKFIDMENQKEISDTVELKPYDVKVFKKL